jgi:hypothetical protein
VIFVVAMAVLLLVRGLPNGLGATGEYVLERT